MGQSVGNLATPSGYIYGIRPSGDMIGTGRKIRWMDGLLTGEVGGLLLV